jgi:anaphase-promoting complex subunit 2
VGSRWRVSILSPARVCLFPFCPTTPSPSRLGHTISSAYIVNFQTHVFSVLPSTFASGFKKLLAATLAFYTRGASLDIPASVQNSKLWPSFELLGLADRYESLIASVCYEHIEAHVLETCIGKWDEPMLSKLREWMADKVVPWMLLPYARGAKTSESASLFVR